MTGIGRRHSDRVVVVTGGGDGIGSATVAELARTGVTVIAVDPGVRVTGEPSGELSAQAAIDLAALTGTRGSASTVSVTDLGGLCSLFTEVVARHGRLDAVVNTAGILRYPSYLGATEDDWGAVLDVHFNGFLNVLEASLPIMDSAGSGRVVGFTSGAGLARTSPGGPAYGCAKRAVAALTWELRDLTGEGITVNAMSPIAATRMVREPLEAAGMSAGSGLDLSAMPQAEDIAPVVSYLACDAPAWWRGQVMFSNGSEISVIERPRVIEAARTSESDFRAALETLVPVVLSAAEADQRTTGGSNQRFGAIFGPSTSRPPGLAAGADGPGCLIVAADADLGATLAGAVAEWGLVPFGAGAFAPFDSAAASIPTGFDDVRDLVRRAASWRPIEALVVALSDDRRTSVAPDWREVVSEHRDVAPRVMANAAWLRAAAVLAEQANRPLRVVFVSPALSPAGRTAAQALAQLARSANDTRLSVDVHTYAVAVESSGADDRTPLAQLVARLLCADDTVGLAGAELVVRPGWMGLRSHPRPVGTVSFGGPELPDWFDAALRELAGG